jgi:hypothetical protein
VANASIRRCAIYTRKSSEEGLEQDYNSLHAQREACEAFIRSQAGEGWKLIKTAYDDGGFSGGTTERPAVQQLMSHIREGSIDVVVVYKVDRLTRSLADFARMVELFDAHGVSFVARSFVPGEGVGNLTCDPFCSRIARHANGHQAPSGVPKNYQAIEQLERDRSHHEQIDGRNPSGVIAQECLPTLGRWGLRRRHVSRHG